MTTPAPSPAHSPAAQAEQCLAVLTRDPTDALVWTQLGDALRGMGQPEAAREAYRNALAHAPRHVPAWVALGAVLTDLRALDEAAAAWRQVLAIDPARHDAATNLAILHHVAGRDVEALGDLGRALAIAPYDVRALILVARIQLRRRTPALAEAACARILAAAPDHADALALHGQALYDTGRLAEAQATLERVLTLAPGHVEARAQLAVTLKSLGDIPAARLHLREALRRDPHAWEAWYTLADLTDFAQEPALADEIAAMTTALAADPARVRGVHDPLIAMHHVCGKALDDRGQHEAALAQWIAAGQLKRASVAYDEFAQRLFIGSIKATFSKAFFADRAIAGDPSAQPVFIVGMPRSGSTLIEQMLASHPLVHGAGEVRHFPQALDALQHAQTALPPYPFLANMLGTADLATIARTYLARLGEGADEAPRIVDKMLTNYLYVGLIHLVFPDARIIHARRDPIDTCVSAFSTWFAEPLPYNYDLAELGRHHARYMDLMAHWEQVLPAGTIVNVDYETLVADPAPELRRVLAALGLAWDARCLDFATARRSVRTASVAQVRRPLYTSSVARWRRYGAGLEPLIAALGPLLAQGEAA